MLRTKEDSVEETSPHYDKTQFEPGFFLSGSWLLLIMIATVTLSLGGSFLHAASSHEQLAQIPPKATIADSASVKAIEKAGAVLSLEDFSKCNVALPPSELSGSQPDASLAGGRCGEAEAASIAEALRRVGYNFETTIPQPYIYPGYLQQVLSSLGADHLTTALTHLQANAPAGRLGTLVKFFAWGLPVPNAELETALDTAALGALLRCQLLAPCSQLPGMLTSSVMLFPVPNTTLLMATDWPSRSTVGMTEQAVPIVNPESMALIYNSPSPTGLRVLDLNSGHGVHGMVAAQRGAASVTLFFQSPRAERFARFSSWLNGLAGAVSMLQATEASEGSLRSTFQTAMVGWSQAAGHRVSNFDLVLAQASFLPLPDDSAAAKQVQNGGPDGSDSLQDVFAVAETVLDQDGVIALVSEFALPGMLDSLGCGPLGLPNAHGSLILSQTALPTEAFAAAHHTVASVEAQVANMKLHDVSAVANGLLFAKRAGKSACGNVSLQYLQDPYARPMLGEARSSRACSLSNETTCPE